MKRPITLTLTDASAKALHALSQELGLTPDEYIERLIVREHRLASLFVPKQARSSPVVARPERRTATVVKDGKRVSNGREER